VKRNRLIRHTARAALRWLWVRRFRPAAWRDLDLRILARVIERNDQAWPQRVGAWVRACDVLDVGCGRNLQSVGFLAEGARSYTGLDPTLDLDSTIMGRFLKVRFAAATIAEFAESQPGRFGVIVMHNVTEHLMAVGDEFARFATLLRDGGRIVFRHPNYYCWHGHHRYPRTIDEIIPGDPEQASVVDWAHVRFDPVRHEWIGRTQNRIRLDELRALTERHFTIERWEENESDPAHGIHRLTPEILTRYPEFQRRDLAVKAVFVVAQKRPPTGRTSPFPDAAAAH
jgi:SAM-dependent methyltransferase